MGETSWQFAGLFSTLSQAHLVLKELGAPSRLSPWRGVLWLPGSWSLFCLTWSSKGEAGAPGHGWVWHPGAPASSPSPPSREALRLAPSSVSDTAEVCLLGGRTAAWDFRPPEMVPWESSLNSPPSAGNCRHLSPNASALTKHAY